MNRTALILSPLVLALSSCAEPPIELRADVAWAFSCAGTIMGGTCPSLSIGGKAWDYIQYDGQLATDETTGNTIGVVNAACNGYPVGGNVYQVDLRAAAGDGEVDISGLQVDVATNTVVDAGFASFRDGVNTYGQITYGQIGTTTPTIDVPCQITLFDFQQSSSDGTVIEVRLRCDGVANVAAPTSKISIRDPGAPSQPALLRFTGCDGF